MQTSEHASLEQAPTLIYDYTLQELDANYATLKTNAFVKFVDCSLDGALQKIPADFLVIDETNLDYQDLNLSLFNSLMAKEKSPEAFEDFLTLRFLKELCSQETSLSAFANQCIPKVMNFIAEFDSPQDFIEDKEPAHFQSLFPCKFFSGSIVRKTNNSIET